jgi:hypothetical protein
VLLAGLALAGGCAMTDGMMNRAPEPVAMSTDISAATGYLDMLVALATGDPATQADIFANARDAYEAAPTTSNRLSYALVLATPGHPASDAMTAQRLLSELLAHSETLMPDEQNLTRIYLASSQERAAMEVEKARLETELNNLRESNTLSRDRQVRNLRAEVAQLRQELEEAERKLDAIANIERAMERGAGDNTQR